MTARQQDVDQLMQILRVRLPGASEAGLKAELFDTFKEFFNDSSVWTEDITLNSVGDGVTTEYILVPTGGQIVRLAGVVDANNIPLAALLPTVGVLNAVLRFQHPFSQVQAFTATVVKTVAMPKDKDDFPVVPDWILPLWSAGIQDGVLGRMMSHPGKTYTNFAQAKYHLGRFRDAISVASIANSHRHSIGAQAWRFPGFANGSQLHGSGGSDRRF